MTNMGKTLLLLGLPLTAVVMVGASGDEKIVTRKYNIHKEDQAKAKRVDRKSATIISIKADPAHTSSMYKACTSFSEMQDAASGLKQDLGTEGAVKVTVSDAAADLACFTFSAPLKYGKALAAEPSTKHLQSVAAIAPGSRKIPSAAAAAAAAYAKNKKAKSKKRKPFRKAFRELHEVLDNTTRTILPPPGCDVLFPFFLGDHECDGPAYNTTECNYDGGDCIPPHFPPPDFPPGCVVEIPSWIGDDFCDGGEYNTEVCEFDGGDCIGFETSSPAAAPVLPPGCVVEIPSWIGNDFCNGGEYNTEVCEFDGGDCVGVETSFETSSPVAAPVLPPGCVVDIPSWIGDNVCDGGDYNTEVCEFDGGDCLGFVLPPGCVVDNPSWIGDNVCDGGDYNTEVCEFDGGDCLGFVLPPGCVVDNPSWIGDGECDGGAYDTEVCLFDGGDCVVVLDPLAPSPAAGATPAPSPANDTSAPSPGGPETPLSAADGSGGCTTASDCYALATPMDMTYLDDNHKELYCDPTCSEEGTSFDGILCNFFGLGQDCRACFLEAGAQQFLTNNPTLTCDIINMCAGEPACEEVEP